MQLEMGMSTSRYLPASGTAGLERSLVSGKSRVPCAAAHDDESTLLMFGDMRLPCDIYIRNPFLELTARPSIPCDPRSKRKRHSAILVIKLRKAV